MIVIAAGRRWAFSWRNSHLYLLKLAYHAHEKDTNKTEMNLNRNVDLSTDSRTTALIVSYSTACTLHTSQSQKPILRNTLYCFSISWMNTSVKFMYDKVSFFYS